MLTSISYKDNLSALIEIQSLFNNKRYSECITACDQLLLKDETIMDAYYFKAMSYYNSNNNIEKTYETFIKQLSLNPKNELTIYNAAYAVSLFGINISANAKDI